MEWISKSQFEANIASNDIWDAHKGYKLFAVNLKSTGGNVGSTEERSRDDNISLMPAVAGSKSTCGNLDTTVDLSKDDSIPFMPVASSKSACGNLDTTVNLSKDDNIPVGEESSKTS